jgi:hypothetical protein
LNSVEGEECCAIYVQTAQTEVATEPRFCSEIADHAAELAAWQCVEPALADLDVDAALKRFDARVTALAPPMGEPGASGAP